MVFISVRNFKLMVSNLKSWFQKLQKSSILKSAALVILWGEEKKGRKNPRFLILKDRGFQAKFVSFFSKNLTMSLFLVRAWYFLPFNIMSLSFSPRSLFSSYAHKPILIWKKNFPKKKKMIWEKKIRTKKILFPWTP